MKLCWLLVFFSGCLQGCQVTPMPASALFGVSNPTATIETPEGTFKVPTNAKVRYKVTRKPEGESMYDLTLSSNASDVVTAEGERIDHMETQRIADFARVVEQEKIRSQERVELYKLAADMAKIALPLMARPVAEPQPASGSPDWLRTLCAANPTLPICAGIGP